MDTFISCFVDNIASKAGLVPSERDCIEYLSRPGSVHDTMIIPFRLLPRLWGLQGLREWIQWVSGKQGDRKKGNHQNISSKYNGVGKRKAAPPPIYPSWALRQAKPESISGPLEQ